MYNIFTVYFEKWYNIHSLLLPLSMDKSHYWVQVLVECFYRLCHLIAKFSPTSCRESSNLWT